MAYLSGVNFGTDQISSRPYLEDISTYNSFDEQTNSGHMHDFGEYRDQSTKYSPIQERYRGQSDIAGLNYRALDDNKKIPSIQKPYYPDFPRTLYDTWRLHTYPKVREGLNGILSIDSTVTLLFYIIIFITIIYCLSIFFLTRQISDMQRLNELSLSLDTLRELISSLKNKPA